MYVLSYYFFLTFCNDTGFGDIRFHAALSNGLSSVGPIYKAASVKTICSDHSTWLTARTEGQRAVLDGQEIMNHITDLVCNCNKSVDCQH